MILSEPAVRRDFPPAAKASTDRLQSLAARLPRPLRFLSVGGLGLLTDLCVFTTLAAYGLHPLIARVFSLAAATLVTWRLNRALTFDRSHRSQGEEAARYTIVTVVAQGTSYSVYALLLLTVFAWMPQAALLIGAAFGAIIGYCGHRFFAFVPKSACMHEASGP